MSVFILSLILGFQRWGNLAQMGICYVITFLQLFKDVVLVNLQIQNQRAFKGLDI